MSGQQRGIDRYLRVVDSNVVRGRSDVKSSEDVSEPIKQEAVSRKRKSTGNTEEESIPPTSAKRGKIGSIIQPEAQNDTNDRKVVGWLNEMTIREARAIESALLSSLTLQFIRQVTGLEVVSVRGLANSVTPNRSGAWYVDEFVRCRVPEPRTDLNAKKPAVTANSFEQDSEGKASEPHGRYQIRVNAAGAGALIQQMTVALTRIDRQRGLDLMARFRSFPSKPDSPDAIVKISRHLLAYSAGRKEDDPLIPLTLGKGASISHYCDTRSCIEKSHLVVEGAHRDNLIRQRCKGVQIVVSTWNRRILHEEPCVHGVDAARKMSQRLVGPAALNAQSLEQRLLLSCRKVHVVDIGSSREQAGGFARRLEAAPEETGKF